MDVFLILLSTSSRDSWAIYAVMASLGEVLGGYLTYRFAEKGGQQTLEKEIGKVRAERVYQRFERYGFLTVLGGAVAPPPFPFTSVLMAAGIMQYPRTRFLAALAAGRSLRFFAEAFLGRTYGRQMIAFFYAHYQAALYALIALAVIGGLAALEPVSKISQHDFHAAQAHHTEEILDVILPARG